VGLDATVVSDKWFLSNYKVQPVPDVTASYFREATSTAFLQGQGDRSFFDARGYYFRALSTYDWQKQQPVVHPVIDYDKRIDGPAPLGGEVAFTANITSLSRQEADFREVPKQLTRPVLLSTTVRPSRSTTPAPCSTAELPRARHRGTRRAPRPSSRGGASSWTTIGQVWTPFTYFGRRLRRAATPRLPEPGLGNFIDPRTSSSAAPCGLRRRVPLPVRRSAGCDTTQVIEPIAQVIARPSETRIGRLPNEDAQSLVFDDTSIFEWTSSPLRPGARAACAPTRAQYSVTGATAFTATCSSAPVVHVAARTLRPGESAMSVSTRGWRTAAPIS
jgi:LPS-assembly protein